MEPNQTRAAQLQRSNGPATGSTEGRRAPRLEVFGQIHGQIIGLDVPIIVCEISVDGFKIATTVNTPIGSIHEFRFTLGDGSVVFAVARAIHSHRVGGLDAATTLFSTGFAFTEEIWRGHCATELIDNITSTLSFDLG
jgi:hypothetical protein